MLRCKVDRDDHLSVEKMGLWFRQGCAMDEAICGLWCPLCVPEEWETHVTDADGRWAYGDDGLPLTRMEMHVTLYCGCEPVTYELVGEEEGK